MDEESTDAQPVDYWYIVGLLLYMHTFIAYVWTNEYIFSLMGSKASVDSRSIY